jgi:hypothetical protein
MPMRTLLTFVSVALIVSACSPTPPAKHDPSLPSVESTVIPHVGDTISLSEGYARIYSTDDTTCFFHKGDRSFRVIVRKAYLDAPAFQDFLDQHPADLVAFRGVECADVTGDGIPDSLITTIRPVAGFPFIEHVVRSGGLQIFFDTLTVDDAGGAEILWDDETSYAALQPYSGIFAAERAFGSFLAGPVILSEEITQEFLDRQTGNTAYWRDYLGRFRGHLIWYLNLTDAGLKVWDARSGSFVDFLVP